MSVRSRKEKGKQFERDVSEWLKKVSGVRYRRTPMSGALRQDFAGDVMKMSQEPSCFDGISIECKNHKTWKPREWIEQCKGEAEDGSLPYWMLVMRNYGGERIYMLPEHLIEHLFKCRRKLQE